MRPHCATNCSPTNALHSLQPGDAAQLWESLDAAGIVDGDFEPSARSLFHCEDYIVPGGVETAAAFAELSDAVNSDAPKAVPLTAADAAAAGLPADMNCHCKLHSCDCDKQCYCHIRTSAYVGARLQPPSDFPGISGTSPMHQCSCNLADVGGHGFEAGNTVDCDCLSANCKCTQSCTCESKP